MNRAGGSALDEFYRRASRSEQARAWSRVLAGMGGAALALGALLWAVGRSPVGAGAGAVGVIAIAAAVGARRGVDPDADRWRRGAEGERATAARLERLPSSRWVVVHDLAVPQSRANIDHLVIGPTGVWVIDTKATRTRVRIRWGRVRFGDRALDTGPVRWEADMVARLLDVETRPVIAVHGVGLRRRGAHPGGVLVVPAERLVRRLRRGRRVLRSAEVGQLAARAEEAFAVAAEPGWWFDE